MRQHDGRDDLLDAIEASLADPDLDAEELGRIVLTVERFVGSGSITEERAGELLAPRRGDTNT